MQKITPFLWFNDQAEDAARFYVSVFRNAKLGQIVRYGDAGPGPKGTAMTVEFELQGIRFIALNGGPHYTITPAISFVVNCETQAEVDDYWAKLSEGGRTDHCAWLQDKFGVSWQVVPTALPRLLADPDPVRSQRVMQAMLKMTKIDIAALERAHRGADQGTAASA